MMHVNGLHQKAMGAEAPPSNSQICHKEKQAAAPTIPCIQPFAGKLSHSPDFYSQNGKTEIFLP
jgi:hypothetical protein